MRLSKETSLFKHDAIAEDLQGVLQTVSDNYTSKSAGVSRSHRIYYRSNSSTKPNPPTTAILGNQAFWVTESGNQYATTGGSSTVMTKWSTKITPMAENTLSGTAKYIYLWTCEQYQMADGNYYATAVLVDDSNVVIDGGNLVAGSVTANHIDTSTLTIGDFSDGGEYTKTDNLGNTTAVQNAAKTASNFIEASSSGVKVRNVSYPNNYSLIDANGLTIYKGGVNVANFGDTARVGQSNSSRFLLNSGSLQAYDSSNNLYFQVSASGMTYGTNNTVATQSYVTGRGYQTQSDVDNRIDSNTKVINAAKTASNYVTDITDAGIFVSPSNQTPSGSSPGNSVKINADGLTVYRSGTDSAFFGSTARIGATSGKHLVINNNGFIFKKDDNTDIGYIKLGTGDSYSLSSPTYSYTESGTTYSISNGLEMAPDGMWFRSGGYKRVRSQLLVSPLSLYNEIDQSSQFYVEDNDGNLSGFTLGFGSTSESIPSINLYGRVAFDKPLDTFVVENHIISIAAGTSGNNVTPTTDPVITKSGYYPIGIVGFGTGRNAAVPVRLALSSRNYGSASVTYSIRAVANFAAVDMNVYVLWVKYI